MTGGATIAGDIENVLIPPRARLSAGTGRVLSVDAVTRWNDWLFPIHPARPVVGPGTLSGWTAGPQPRRSGRCSALADCGADRRHGRHAQRHRHRTRRTGGDLLPTDRRWRRPSWRSGRGRHGPLNPAYREDEFEFYLSDLSRALRRSPPAWSSPARGRRPAASASRSSNSWLSWTGRPVLQAAGHAAARLRQRPAAWPRPDDVALLLHTSGTTSRPKLVPLSQRHHGLGPPHRGDAGAGAGRSLPQHHAAVPHPRPDRGRCSSSLAAAAACLHARFNASSSSPGSMKRRRPGTARCRPCIRSSWRAPSATETIARRKLRFIRSSSASLPPPVMAELEADLRLSGHRVLRHDRGPIG